MTWQQLLTSGSVVAHRTSKNELDSLRSIVDRDLADAALTGLSADRAFGIAYNAALILAKIAIAASGYRVKGEGAHRVTFAAFELAMGPAVSNDCAFLDTCRRKRNRATYDVAGSIAHHEATDLRLRAAQLRERVEAWIRASHPHLA